MTVYFDASEILQFAIRIEENGEKFYRKIAETSEDDKVKELFSYLAGEEIKHREIFEGMVNNVKKYNPPETYPGEYFQYLRAYADELIFPPRIVRELESGLAPLDALDFGIRRELDSIMYYIETKVFVPETQHKIIDKIIEEERNHFVKLSQLKDEMKK
jgi:rubrerythrin